MQPLRSATISCGWEVLDALPPAMWFIRRTMRTHRGKLSVPQFRAMVLVNNQTESTLSAVADHLGLSLPTASRLITGLVGRGLLSRRECAKDRRQVSLGITAKGRGVLDGAYAAAQEDLAREMEALTPSERSQIVGGMRVLKKVFGALGLPSTENPMTKSQNQIKTQ